MIYKNAKDILPKELFELLQKYAAGELLYIPQDGKKRYGWGEKSGTRQELVKRNAEINAAFINGQSFDQIADDYCLSTDSIRKIVYAKVSKS